MKTAISIDDELYYNAENFSRSSGISRSKLYCIAIKEYILNNTPNLITERLNNYYDKHDSRLDDDVKAAAIRLFNEEDW